MSTELADSLRSGLRRLAKAVVVITTRHEGIRYAMAATAVSELSMDPPSLLICVNKSASLDAPLSAGAGFCVNILHAGQGDISARCTAPHRGEERFALGEWATSALGIPYLKSAQASFLCEAARSVQFGTHGVFIGIVREVHVSGAVDPLVYVDGRYAALSSASH